MESLIDMSWNTSSRLQPDVSLNYEGTYMYFNKFLPNNSGMVYSYISTKPNVYLKSNNRLKDVELYYSSKITISKKIHNIPNTSSNDLEMFIEHTPAKDNYNRSFLYVCFGLTFDLSSNNGNEFNTFFYNINVDNMKLDTQTQNASLDNLKKSQKWIPFNSALSNIIGTDQVVFPSGTYYIDASGNKFIILNTPVSIAAENYERLKTFFKSPTNIQNVLNTAIIPKKKNEIYPIICNIRLNESFQNLKEGFANLREGATFINCRPSDSSNGNRVTTVAINGLTQNNQDSQIIDWIIVSVVMLILIIFLYFIVPGGYVFINSNLNYNTYLIWTLKIFTGLFFIGGGIAAIVCSRVIEECPKWITQLGIFVIIAYTLLKLMIIARKDDIILMLTNKSNNTTDVDVKKKINAYIQWFESGPL